MFYINGLADASLKTNTHTFSVNNSQETGEKRDPLNDNGHGQ